MDVIKYFFSKARRCLSKLVRAFKNSSLKPDSRFLRQAILWAESSYFFLQGCSSHFRTSGLLCISQFLLHAVNCVSKSECKNWLGSSHFLDRYTNRWLKRITQSVSLHENDISLLSTVRVIDSFLSVLHCLDVNQHHWYPFSTQIPAGSCSVIVNELLVESPHSMILAG